LYGPSRDVKPTIRKLKGEDRKMKAATSQKTALMLCVGLTAQIALGARQEIVITDAAGDQQMPAVWQSKVVWEGIQSNNWDIFLKDVADPQAAVRRLGGLAASGEDRNPSVWGNTIVWQKKSSAGKSWDIWAADINDPTSIMPFSVDTYDRDQQHPRIWGTSVVYESFDGQYWWIPLMDISDPVAPAYAGGFGLMQSSSQYPAIWEHLLVFQTTYEGWDIDAADASDPNRLYAWVFSDDDDQQRPAVYGHWVVWQDDYAGDWDVMGRDMSDPFSWNVPICEREGSNARSPAIWNNVVVWQDDRNGNSDIYGYNLTTQKEFRITDNSKDQTSPAISFSESLKKYVVVWQDNRNGNGDIYGVLIDGVEVAGCVNPVKWDVNADSVVDAQDVSEVQQHVGERNGISP
jgi:beta propeller repeat protein